MKVDCNTTLAKRGALQGLCQRRKDVATGNESRKKKETWKNKVSAISSRFDLLNEVVEEDFEE
ncbi:hypothetical protein Goari_004393 [Gossypium aridum]|uniref:Uncharacterized protein n=1 Tax=Gossypium aridum TaxID=34290 RepID=A0A7J8Y399_GOSAI|nr:hypothetical protein [Gossypium aridum]